MVSPQSVMSFSAPFLDFVKEIPPIFMSHDVSSTVSVVTFPSKPSDFSPDPF